jgi:cytidylate kinase
MRPFDEPYFDSLSVALYRFTNVARKRPSLNIDPKGRVRAGSTRFDDKDYSKIVADFVRDLYLQKKAVIAGRGSQCILADHPDVLHVRIEAPREYRIQLCQERLEVAKARAGKIVRDMDLRQENFLKHFFRVKGDESRLYHVILNSGKISIDTMVDILEGLLRE